MCFIPNVERRYCQLILIALIRPVISNYAHLRRDNSVCVCVCWHLACIAQRRRVVAVRNRNDTHKLLNKLRI